ncbi:TPA: restriction endonuclease subunit S, partial [Streptococcus equi subsp. zooepidemicus]|nr:restriction endonuclease subunit S [Streptococcus equi subsp. zooepidemicus]
RFKSQFIEMFGLPESNVHGFEIGTIGDVAKDVHYGTAKKASEDGKYIYIRMNNITYEGELDLSDIKRIDVPDKELAGCIVQEGDVLFNRTNSKDLVGKTCYFSGAEPMVIAGYIIRLRMNGKVLPEYLSTFMNLERSKKLLYSMAKGAVGQANINAKEVQSIEMIIPPLELQTNFLTLFRQSDKSK